LTLKFIYYIIYNVKGDVILKFLVIGDIVGKSGMDKLKKELPVLICDNKIDFCIVNGENSANGKGIRKKEYNEILSYGADIITMGNHIYYRKEMLEEYKNLERLAIPANVTNIIGNKYVTVEKNGVRISCINLIGQFGMGSIFEKNTTNPFRVVKEQLEKIKAEQVNYIFVDFHAEATAEKIAMGYFLEDKVTCMFGTHTHVQTSDEEILNDSMAYITDVGMTGPKESVIGLKKEVALKRFVDEAYAKYECSQNESILNGIIIETNDDTQKPVSIKRLFLR
jgi:hypothetical protein